MSDSTIKMISTRFEVTDGQFVLRADIACNGRITFKIKHCQDDFRFINSDPKFVRSVANLMLLVVEKSENMQVDNET